LSPESYGDLEIIEIVEGANVGTGQLSFDQNLGFINFRIDLMDNENGGIEISEQSGWVKLAVLKFDLLKISPNSRLVWGRPEVTNQYATAFVELTEWVAPYETSALNIMDYQDGDLSFTGIQAPLQVKVGPNPTSNFLKIDFATERYGDLQLVLTDVSGTTWINEIIPNGSNTTQIDISGLSSAIYMVDLIDVSNGVRIHHTQVTKVD
jgi:hypothetical protein